MEKYPASYREFEVNGVKGRMYRITLGLQSRIEDENIEVLQMDVLKDCTDLDDAAIASLRGDQFEALYRDVMAFNYEEAGETEGRGDAKKPHG